MIGILLYQVWLLFQINLVSRNKTVRWKELLNIFAVGASAAVLGNLLIQGLAVRYMGSDLVYYTVGPVAEEVLKISFVVFLLFFTRLGKTTGVSDAVLMAAAAGAGYGFTEDAVRAIGLGFTSMIEAFPAYDVRNFAQLLTSWLPSERSIGTIMDYEYIGRFVAGHLMWTALVGFGVGVARKFGKKNAWAYCAPLALLFWVIVDHSLVNQPDSWLGFLYPLYGKGAGIRYALTLAIFAALILDEMKVNRNLPPEKILLLPGEKNRSVSGELVQSMTHWTFGTNHWHSLIGYFHLRRQLAFASEENPDSSDIREIVKIRRDHVIASVRIGNQQEHIPASFREIWQGPPLVFTRLNTNQKILSVVAFGLLLTQLYSLWLFLFSVYLPRSLSYAIANSSLTFFTGLIGYLVVLYQMISYYRTGQSQPKDQENNRITCYANPLLTHTAGLNIVWNLPFFFGQHPLLVDKFLWSQFLRFLEFFQNGPQKWVGGTLSATIGFLPGIGNIKSGFEAWHGYDYIAGKEVRGWDRFWAGVGAVPLAGNALRAMRYLPKSVRLVQGLRYRALLHSGLRPAIIADNIMGKIGYVSAVKDDYSHALNELKKEYAPIEQMKADRMARERQNALEQWDKDGWIKQVDTGHYQKTLQYQAVDIYTGKALHQFPESVHGAGQVTVDHAGKTVMYDGISAQYSAQKSDHLVKALGDLQKQYPGSTIIYNQLFKSGASVLHIQPPTGMAFQTTHMPIQAVGSR